MKLTDILTENAIYNIIGHCKKCWDYTYPTGKALEEAIYRGLKPFYQDTQSLGAPNTIVDVAKNKEGFDAKGGKQLDHLMKIGKSANNDNNIFVEQILPNALKVKVKIPTHITTMVQRPSVDMENWKGDPVAIINKSIAGYQKFANDSIKAIGCKQLYSIVVLYGEDQKKGCRSLFFTLEDFSIPEIATAKHYLKKNGTNAGYLGLDNEGNVIYSLAAFNRGSVNSYKKFKTTKGFLYTWLIEEIDPVIYDKQFLEKDGTIQIVK
jgi:hypothetical protein